MHIVEEKASLRQGVKGAFAMSKLPFEEVCTIYFQEESPTMLHSIEALNGRQGFVFAPFKVSNEHPVLLLEDAETEVIDIAKLAEDTCGLASSALQSQWNDGFNSPSSATQSGASAGDKAAERTRYGKVFNVYHQALVEGKFHKLVLARQSEVAGRALNLREIFVKACRLYPRQHVILFASAVSGVWLMATPEVLLSKQKGEKWHTMALAGTMKATENDAPMWSEKNKMEQNMVSDYIEECLQRYAQDIERTQPYTTFAADLAHLRTDFRFTLPSENHLGSLLHTLHPTPAVCGIPKDQAQEFILRNEQTTRSYYSGFAGSLAVNGETQLFVSLRCMQLGAHGSTLHAGGGILKASNEESEWQETEAKLQTMRLLLMTKE